MEIEAVTSRMDALVIEASALVERAEHRGVAAADARQLESVRCDLLWLAEEAPTDAAESAGAAADELEALLNAAETEPLARPA